MPQCQALGVKIVLFAKFTWADRATKRFREDLLRLAIKDPYGDYYHYQGYQYQTATQLLDINTKRLIPMCFLSEEYLRVCDEEFRKTVELGADGILFDECLHHSPALLCFDPSHGHRTAAPVYANDRQLIQNFGRISGRSNPDFLFAGEACYDWEMEAYHLSYHRSESKQHIPLSPLHAARRAVHDRGDRLRRPQHDQPVPALPLHHQLRAVQLQGDAGRLPADAGLRQADGRAADGAAGVLLGWRVPPRGRRDGAGSIRRRAQGQEVRPHHPYAVFISRKSGKAGVVVANYDERQAVTVQVALDNGQALGRYRLVDDPTWRSTADGIVLPPMSAAVVVE